MAIQKMDFFETLEQRILNLERHAIHSEVVHCRWRAMVWAIGAGASLIALVAGMAVMTLMLPPEPINVFLFGSFAIFGLTTTLFCMDKTREYEGRYQ